MKKRLSILFLVLSLILPQTAIFAEDMVIEGSMENDLGFNIEENEESIFPQNTAASGYTEVVENFQYNDTNCNYLTQETAYAFSHTADVIAENENWSWVATSVHGIANSRSGHVFMQPVSKAVRLQGHNTLAMGSVNFVPKNEITVGNVSTFDFKINVGTRAQGLNIFVSEDEKSYIMFGTRNGETVTFGGTLPGSRAYMAVYKDGSAKKIFEAPAPISGTNWEGESTWSVTVSGNNISWIAEKGPNQWAGTYTDTDGIVGGQKYIMAPFAIGDTYGYVKEITFKTGDYYTGGMGEPATAVYKRIAANRVDPTSPEFIYEFDGEPQPIRRGTAAGIRSGKVMLSADGTAWDEFTTDNSGNWYNDQTDTAYKYVKTEAAPRGVFGLTEVEVGETIKLKKNVANSGVFLYYNGSRTASGDWASADAEKVSIATNGLVTAVKDTTDIDGTVSPVEITVSDVNGNPFTFNVVVEGDMTEAINDETLMPAYIASQQSIVDNLNTALTNQSSTDVENFFFGADRNNNVTFKELDAVTTTELNALNANAGKKALFVNRMMTYAPDFSVASLEDIVAFENDIVREVKVGEMNNVSAANFGTRLDQYNDFFKLPLDSNYYKAVKNNLLANMAQSQYVNYGDLVDKFNENLILENIESSLNPAYITTMLEDYADFIGYNKSKFALVKSQIGTAALNGKSTLTTIGAVKDFVNNYQYVDTTPTPAPILGGGGGGGGGSKPAINKGDEVTYLPTVNIDPDNEGKVTAVDKAVIFDDVPTEHWSYEAVRYLKAKGAVSGYEDGEFKPNQDISRAEFTVILMNAFGVKPEPKATPAPEASPAPEGEEAAEGEEATEETEETTEEAPVEEAPVEEEKAFFNDIKSSDWHYDYLNLAGELGIMTGADGMCRPNDNITREEIAALIFRMVEHKSKTLDNTQSVISFADEDYISDWAFSAVVKLQYAGVINGNNGYFLPKDNASRAEASQMIYKAVTNEAPAAESVNEGE